MHTLDRGILRAHQTKLSLLQKLLDLLVISAALTTVKIVLEPPGVQEQIICNLVALFIFYQLGETTQLYNSWRGERIRDELRKVGGIWSMSFAIAFLISHFVFDRSALRDQGMLQWFALALLTLCGYRIALRMVLNRLRRRGINTRTVAIAGAGELGQRLAEQIAAAPWMGLELHGFFDDKRRQPVRMFEEHASLPVHGDLAALVEQARAGSVERIYITLPMGSEARIRWLVEQLSDTTASVYMVPDVFTFGLLHARSQNINGVPTISIFDSPLTGVGGVLKRLEDIALAFLILCLIALPMLAIAVAVKLSSPGPVFFRQKRYGIDGRPIEVWKFRSMRVMENGAQVTQATRGDKRITPIGGFLRRTSLDELPQFINVLLGDMSIVGPRPHAVAHNEQYRRQINSYMLRHKVKPGITGWAQVNGWRGETDTLDKMQKRVEHDLVYIHNWSLWWDLKIVFLTVFKGFVHKNAY
ncbi:undecaprenyl-phosphate glucose phosphotransferase [Pseudomonas citronellolis]|uniref:undecaprenyl-phosphate glucose phosphotransferase n=1 Tax=Pseudomonas citronellolis TaxID=53408 RepID=UPI0023E3E77C|nr:undecaprenyl-phosphate glucose phosphotransferase [Pseudomonas citronellolis]MDF3932268.1 undecaprenyl-phosphate glucose phosphotransferase [Pseudomonas citronellolis]